MPYNRLKLILIRIKRLIEMDSEFISTEVEKLSLDFFIAALPHGGPKYEVIDTLAKVESKLVFIKSLFSIHVAFDMMSNEKSWTRFNNWLEVTITAVDTHSKNYKLIADYIQNSSVHGYKINILDLYSARLFTETFRILTISPSENRMLLWHGTKLANIASILTEGLQIKKSVNGSMFGRGIYFSDVASKAANYCKVEKGEIGVLILAEVALGKKFSPSRPHKYLTDSPHGFNSVFGQGATRSSPTSFSKTDNGVTIPSGKLFRYPDTEIGLRYNEYCVYDPNRVQIRYLVMFTQEN